jgi:hypothetical protein
VGNVSALGAWQHHPLGLTGILTVIKIFRQLLSNSASSEKAISREVVLARIDKLMAAIKSSMLRKESRRAIPDRSVAFG